MLFALSLTFAGSLTGVVGAAQAVEPGSPCGHVDIPASQGKVVDVGLNEISGLAIGSAGMLWVVEDSGNAPMVYGLDASGAVKVQAPVANVRNTDWEELGVGPCAESGRCLYVGDFGDNQERRKVVSILRIPEPTTDAPVSPEILRFTFPDGPQNTEAMTVGPTGAMKVYTKRDDGTTRVYELPVSFNAAVPVSARFLGTLPVDVAGSGGKLTRITGATSTPDGSYLWLRSYIGVWGFPADPAAPTGWSEKRRVTLPAPSEAQGEAIAWDGTRSGYWQLSEAGEQGVLPTVWYTGCRP